MMSNFFTNQFRLSPIVVAILICADSAIAQTSPDKSDADETKKATSLGTITVTGSKFERDLQETYTSTGVLTGEETSDLDVKDFREAMQLQSNVYVAPSNAGNNGISIRGINSEGLGEASGNLRPMMTMTIDGASQSFEGIRRGQRGTWDIDQIEVARGPQSITQGRNALAGSITINTKDPTPYWEGAVRHTGSSLDGSAPALMISGPINDDISFRFAGESLYEEKDIRFTNDSADFFADDEYSSLRGKLLYKPNALPELSIKLTLSDTTDKPAVTAVTDNTTFDPFDRVNDIEETAAEKRENDVQSNVLDVSYELADDYTFKSITAYTVTDAMLDGRGGSFFRDEIRTDTDINQEFRLEIGSADSDVSGILGLFWGKLENDRDSLVITGTTVFQNLKGYKEDTSTAVFGELRYQLNSRIGFNIGARYQRDISDSRTHNRLEEEIIEGRYESSAFLPQAGIIYNFNSKHSLAFNISSGYRSGFINADNSDSRTIDPEFLTSYEIAYRSSLLKDTLTFNTNIFYYDWNDMQITSPVVCGDPSDTSCDSTDTFSENAGSASSYGTELNLTWKPHASGLKIGSSLGLLQTRLDEYYSSEAGQDFSNNEFPEAPRYSGSLWFIYRFGNNWFSSADYVYRGDAFSTGNLSNDKDRKVPAYDIVDVRFGYEIDNFSVLLGVENLFDEDYITGRDTRGSTYVGDKRTYKITLSGFF